MDSGERLAQLIEESPDDFEAYRAYADWLEEQGDPRSQLMGMHITRERVTDRNKLDHLEARLAELFEKHREHFLGKLANVLPKPTSSRQARENAARLEWRWGFVRKLECRRFGRLTIDKFLDHLLAHPSGRFIVELSASWLEHPDKVVAVLAKRAPLSLRKLSLGADTDLEALWPRLARLEEIDVSSREHGDIDLPELRRAAFWVTRATELVAIAKARWPKLEHLALHFEREDTATAAQIIPVFERHLPAFRSLALGGRDHVPELLRTLASLPMGKQLVELEVRFDDDVAAALATFERPIELLKVSKWDVDRARAAAVAKTVEATD